MKDQLAASFNVAGSAHVEIFYTDEDKDFVYYLIDGEGNNDVYYGTIKQAQIAAWEELTDYHSPVPHGLLLSFQSFNQQVFVYTTTPHVYHFVVGDYKSPTFTTSSDLIKAATEYCKNQENNQSV